MRSFFIRGVILFAGLALAAGVLNSTLVLAQGQECTTKYDEGRQQWKTTCSDGTTATKRYDAGRDQYRTTIESPQGRRQQCVQKYNEGRQQWRTTCD